jgi:hypothetical protein
MIELLAMPIKNAILERFDSKWVNWVMKFVRGGGSICINTNDENNSYLNPAKGLRQGILYPLCFLI